MKTEDTEMLGRQRAKLSKIKARHSRPTCKNCSYLCALKKLLCVLDHPVFASCQLLFVTAGHRYTSQRAVTTSRWCVCSSAAALQFSCGPRTTTRPPARSATGIFPAMRTVPSFCLVNASLLISSDVSSAVCNFLALLLYSIGD